MPRPRPSDVVSANRTGPTAHCGGPVAELEGSTSSCASASSSSSHSASHCSRSAGSGRSRRRLGPRSDHGHDRGRRRHRSLEAGDAAEADRRVDHRRDPSLHGPDAGRLPVRARRVQRVPEVLRPHLGCLQVDHGTHVRQSRVRDRERRRLLPLLPGAARPVRSDGLGPARRLLQLQRRRLARGRLELELWEGQLPRTGHVVEAGRRGRRPPLRGRDLPPSERALVRQRRQRGGRGSRSSPDTSTRTSAGTGSSA